MDLVPDAVSAESPAGGGGLLEYWRTLFRHKRLMTAFALAGALAGYLYCLPQTPTFQAATSVEVTELNESFLNMTNLDPSARTYSDESKLLTEMKMLESKSLRRLVRENLLAEPAPPRVYERDQLSALLEALGLPQYRTAPSYEGAIAMAASTLQIRNPRQTRIVEILCDSNDPKVAADFVNALTQTYIDETIQGRLSSFQRTTEWLNNQLDEIRVKLGKSQDELLSYAKASGLVLTGEAEQKLRSLQGELSDAQRDVYIRDAMYEVAKSSPPGTLPQALDHNLVQTYERQLADKEAELVRSRTSLAPQHYRVQAIETELSHLRSALKEARSTVVKRVENEFSAARIRRDLLEQAYVDHSREVSNQSDKVIHYNMLKQEADTNQELYRSMTQRLKEANIASAMRASTVRVVDPAEPAGSPSSPNPLRSSIIGFSTGIFVAVLFVFVRSSSNEKFQSPGDAATYLQVPEWGVIPSVQKPVRQGRPFLNLLGTRLDRSNGAATNGNTLISPDKDSAELVTWNWKPSVHAESFRAVLASLLAHSAESRTYVIASPESAAGKSTTTCNLGIALAEIGRRVVVVDADLRNPRLHKVFDVSSTWGLTSIINDSVPVEELPKEALAKPTSIENLYLLPSGPGVASISRLFYSPRLKQTLARLREDFDMVLIDTPPMLQFADARALAQCADDVILVFRAAHTARRTGLAALQKFQEDGVEVRGIILNDWNPSFTGDNSYNFKLKVSYKP